MEREKVPGGVIALLLVVATLAAMAEVVAGRPLATAPEAWRESSAALFLRAGDEARARRDVAAARRAYMTALFRARGERSLSDVVGAAEGFAALGDHEVLEQALTVAASLGSAGDATARARLATLRERAEPGAALSSAVR